MYKFEQPGPWASEATQAVREVSNGQVATAMSKEDAATARFQRKKTTGRRLLDEGN